MEQLNLTQEELDLIKAKREKAEADKIAKDKELEVKKAEELTKFEKRVQREINECGVKNSMITGFFNQLNQRIPGKYVLKTEKKSTELFCKLSYRDETPLATQTIEYNVSHIELATKPYADCRIQISASFHSSGYAGHGEWRMCISGLTGDRQTRREYTNIRKVNEKVDEEVDANLQAINKQKANASAKELAIAMLTKRYPDAVIKVEQTGYYRDSYRHRDFVSYEVINVVLPNQIQIQVCFSLNSDGTVELQLNKVQYGSNIHKKVLELADALAAINL